MANCCGAVICRSLTNTSPGGPLGDHQGPVVRYPENAAQGWPQDEDWCLTHAHTKFADQRRTASRTSVNRLWRTLSVTTSRQGFYGIRR